MSSFLGHVDGYGSVSLKQNTDLACYCSNQSVEIAIQGYVVKEGQVSDIRRHASRPPSASRGVHLLKRCQYLSTLLCSSVEAISIRFLLRQKLEK